MTAVTGIGSGDNTDLCHLLRGSIVTWMKYCSVWHHSGCCLLYCSDFPTALNSKKHAHHSPGPLSHLLLAFISHWAVDSYGRFCTVSISKFGSDFLSTFHFYSCKFLGLKTNHQYGVHQEKFCFWLVVFGFPLGWFHPVHGLIFGAFEGLLWASRVLAWFSIVFSFPSNIIQPFTWAFTCYLCCIWFWGSSFLIRKYMMFNGERAQ
jgi:hypothetical protein